MENEISIETKEPTCSICKTAMDTEEIYCSECGFPEKGTDKEVAQFHARRAMENNQHMDADKKIKSARNVLYVMAGITLVFGIISFFNNQDIAVLVTNVILGVIYLALGSWTSQKPLVAILLGLLLYLTTVIISAILLPETLIKGIIFKIIIIAYLGKGVYSASSIKK
ncbi:hypothetical protein [Winogradskyella luteola]|uniref:Zinc ribbon domain-containing protein n=1 Tax=Winogradskyella luteola TaxID=2828330 RepID=A0A9X1F9A9_9FLAO|nr:hypothetical protein [Winogradskyella luteola]MBV7268788.1 hypothetical protein [Winogradskyella luteola]